MSAFEKKYFSSEGGLNYKALLKHFKDQANGHQNVLAIRSPSQGKSSVGGDDGLRTRFNRPTVHSGLVIVDMAKNGSRDDDYDEDDAPRVEVIDPTEAQRRRALDRLVQERKDKTIASGNIKRLGKGKRGHSLSGDDRADRSRAKKIVKKTKDFFED